MKLYREPWGATVVGRHASMRAQQKPSRLGGTRAMARHGTRAYNSMMSQKLAGERAAARELHADVEVVAEVQEIEARSRGLRHVGLKLFSRKHRRCAHLDPTLLRQTRSMMLRLRPAPGSPPVDKPLAPRSVRGLNRHGLAVRPGASGGSPRRGRCAAAASRRSYYKVRPCEVGPSFSSSRCDRFSRHVPGLRQQSSNRDGPERRRRG